MNEPIVNSEIIEISQVLLTFLFEAKSTASRIFNISLYLWQKAAREHATDNWTLDAAVATRGKLLSKIGLATERFRAIDLSCRACGAGAWALGLDSRLGPPLRFGFHRQPPIICMIHWYSTGSATKLRQRNFCWSLWSAQHTYNSE